MDASIKAVQLCKHAQAVSRGRMRGERPEIRRKWALVGETCPGPTGETKGSWQRRRCDAQGHQVVPRPLHKPARACLSRPKPGHKPLSQPKIGGVSQERIMGGAFLFVSPAQVAGSFPSAVMGCRRRNHPPAMTTALPVSIAGV